MKHQRRRKRFFLRFPLGVTLHHLDLKVSIFVVLFVQRLKRAAATKTTTKKFFKNYLRIFGQGGFHVGATFEMRTTLCKINLLNDNKIMYDRIFLSNQKMRGESDTAGRQKERESVRNSALLEMRD
jgi:hypothetical protein